MSDSSSTAKNRSAESSEAKIQEEEMVVAVLTVPEKEKKLAWELIRAVAEASRRRPDLNEGERARGLEAYVLWLEGRLAEGQQEYNRLASQAHKLRVRLATERARIWSGGGVNETAARVFKLEDPPAPPRADK